MISVIGVILSVIYIPINKPFKGTEVYHPENMPDIDYLVITHNHWDHLDYQAVQELKPRIGIVPINKNRNDIL